MVMHTASLERVKFDIVSSLGVHVSSAQVRKLLMVLIDCTESVSPWLLVKIYTNAIDTFLVIQ